jgi:hypothetical protein
MIVVQDSWIEDDDDELHDYLKKNDISYKMLGQDDIKKIDPKTVSIMFCDTSLTQSILNAYNVYNEIETYPESLKSFYKRDIKKILPKELLTKKYNYFVKPISNNKSFNGTLVQSDFDREFVLSQIDDFNEPIYCCDEIKPVNEYRIFVVDYKMFGAIDCTEYLIDEKDRKSVELPKEYVDDILKHNTYSHCVIDVALDISGKYWYVIEVNPPFALMSYGFPIDKYVEFCKKSWLHYVAKIK